MYGQFWMWDSLDVFIGPPFHCFSLCVCVYVHICLLWVDVRKSQYFPTRNNKFRVCYCVSYYYYFYYLLNALACSCLSSTIWICPKNAERRCGQRLVVFFLFFFCFFFSLFTEPLIMKQNEWCKCVRLAHARKHGILCEIQRFLFVALSPPVHITFSFSF